MVIVSSGDMNKTVAALLLGDRARSYLLIPLVTYFCAALAFENETNSPGAVQVPSVARDRMTRKQAQ